MKKNYLLIVFIFLPSFFIYSQNSKPLLHLTYNDFVKEKEGELLKNEPSNQLDNESQRLLNFHPVTSFSLEDTDKLSKNIGNLKQASVFTVYQLDDASIERELWKIEGDESSIFMTTKQTFNSSYSSSYERGENPEPLINTFVQRYTPSKNNKVDHQGITLGSYTDDKTRIFEGVIAEVMVYNRVLRGKTRQSIASYLALKYGITLENGESYVSSTKDVVYNVEDYPDFGTRIAGIGRDQKNRLNQKQSKSTAKNAVLTIGLGEVAATNEENSSVLQNKTFIIWGDNGKEIAHKSQDVEGFGLLEREWRIEATGRNLKSKDTQVILDLSEMNVSEDESLSNYNLVIDRNSKGEYDKEGSEYISATTIKNGKVFFDNINWDTDKSGSDRFTFYLKLPLNLEILNNNISNCESIDSNGSLVYKTRGGVAPFSYKLTSSNGYIKEWKQQEYSKEEKTIKELPGGSYTLKVTDVTGAIFNEDYEVTSPEQFVVDLGPDRSFEFNQTEMILTSPLENNEDIEYIWKLNNSSIGTGRSVLIKEPGTYQLTAKNSNGCISTDDVTITSGELRAYTVYPNNSSDGNYTIDISLSEAQDILIEVYDMTGRLVNSTTAKNQKRYLLQGKRIPTSGVYHIVLKTETQKTSQKLVIN
ncbi:T9SS type A sorting domain-containing protein [Tenacibaculum sp.]|uniref:T9SS type A sorting domain-containing protein n=1 Tax=Tenacibaculum sp. TaxID=1906242 RepID=UPI003AA93AC6